MVLLVLEDPLHPALRDLVAEHTNQPASVEVADQALERVDSA